MVLWHGYAMGMGCWPSLHRYNNSTLYTASALLVTLRSAEHTTDHHNCHHNSHRYPHL